jgi:hypothetical protein
MPRVDRPESGIHTCHEACLCILEAKRVEHDQSEGVPVELRGRVLYVRTDEGAVVSARRVEWTAVEW